MNIKITVIGAGQWGTTLAHILAETNHQVFLYSRNADSVRKINASKCNPDYLPDISLSSNLVATDDPVKALENAQYIFFAVPSTSFRGVLQNIRPYVAGSRGESHNKIFASTIKGLESATLYRPSEVFKELFGDDLAENLVAISGPNFALEVIQSLPAATVVAGPVYATERVCSLFANTNIRAYPSDDLTGIEIAAVMKNVVALACGISDGLGLGYNARAALITHGAREMRDIVLAIGGKMETLFSPAGIGDLVLTSTSSHSRNWKAGFQLGKQTGYSGTVEGANSVLPMYELALEKLPNEKLVLLETIKDVLHGGLNAASAMELLWSDIGGKRLAFVDH